MVAAMHVVCIGDNLQNCIAEGLVSTKRGATELKLTWEGHGISGAFYSQLLQNLIPLCLWLGLVHAVAVARWWCGARCCWLRSLSVKNCLLVV